MNFEQVETEVKKLSKKVKKESFVYDFLAAFGTAKSTITMLKNGSRNLSKKENEIICKKKILFSSVEENVEQYFEEVIADTTSFKHDPRFIVVTDHENLFALDTKLMDRVDFKVKDIHKKFDFFLPLAGIEKRESQHENPVDVKAAEKLAKLFDLIKLNNPKSDEKSLHSLNVFLTRLLFCFFAEDTDIFQKSLFTNNLGSHTQPDGSDLSSYLEKIFEIMNQKERDDELPDYITVFPYVNGGLFAESHTIPKFCKKSRMALLEVGELDWAEINPDIFGSMIQAVVHPDQRAGLGMHYTSVPNIMKLINPLFLNDLYLEFNKSKKSQKKLTSLLNRISKIKIFDPACGSGNFLIIAYKKLRLLEMEILKELNQIPLSSIKISSFYGVELDDFAHEVAILSLWLAEHQMDILFNKEFGNIKESLPLKEGGNITCNNAAHVDWEAFCEVDENSEIYILGNPPYLGARGQSSEQKNDMVTVFQDVKGVKNLDYISIWFKKSSDFIKNVKKCHAAFVSTNSITQGAQVSILWPEVINDGVEISFCHQSFKWTNSAKNQAAVICVIIGLRYKSNKQRYIYVGDHEHKAKKINAYLSNAEDVYVYSRRKPLSDIPEVNYGSFALDDGNYTLDETEKNQLVSQAPEVAEYIREFIGAKELLQGHRRYCLWMQDADLNDLNKIKPLEKKIAKVKSWRSSSNREATVKLAKTPHLFAEVRQPKSSYLAFPTVSSERREYIPIAFLDKKVIASNQIYVIPTADFFHFGILSSKTHMAWVRAVSGRLKTDIRYSSAICYNNFPLPFVSEESKSMIEDAVKKIFVAREKHSSKTLSTLYDPDKMPEELLEAHRELDASVDKAYGVENGDDFARLDNLMKLYSEKMKVDND